MATVIQTIVMTPDYVPYERPPQPQALWTAIPRGLQSFIVDTQQLDLKAINDTQILQLTATLPPNFGYVMVDANTSISQDQADDWQSAWSLNLQNFYRAPVNISVGLSSNWLQDFRQGLTVSTRHMSQVQPWPSFPIIGSAGTTGILVVMTMINSQAAAAVAGTVNAYISFWQFDLEQIRKFPINSPIPTHPR